MHQILYSCIIKIFLASMDRENKCKGDFMFFSIQQNHNSHEDTHPIHFNSLVKPEEPTVGDSNPVSVTDFIYSSSLQIGHRDYSISFQDDFIKEHEKAIRKQIENFMESSFKQSNIKNITFESEEIFREDLEYGLFKNSEDLVVEFQNKNKFLHQIKNENGLEELFSSIFDVAPKKIASEIFYVCSYAFSEWQAKQNCNADYQNFIWQTKEVNYKCFQNELEAVKQAKRLADKLSEKLYKDGKIKFLNLSGVSKSELNEETTVKKAFKLLIEFLFATFGLVGSGYFNNPYSESDQFKRSRSFRLEEDDEEYSSSSTDNQLGLIGQPRKRIH